MDTSPHNTLGERETAAQSLWAVWGAVLASLLLYSAIRSPAPGVNEPHYLCKAKAYWNADYCPEDFFLESSNAHLVFYQSVGHLTRVFALEQTAWIGRLAALGILAWGWVCCIRRIVPGSWISLWAMWMFLAIAAAGNWSGEWMVGGVEGKVFAYGLGFWAIAVLADRRVKWAGFLGGLSVSFHPVVGGWMVISAAAAMLATRFFEKPFPNKAANDVPSPTPRDWALAAGIFLLASLPGIWPAIGLLGGEDVQQAKTVAWIQVFYRIKHHLDPMTFSRGRYTAYGLMIVLWLLARHRLKWGAAERWFAWFTGASILIALAGVGLGYGERPIASLEDITWRYRLLKFYPFRLADILVPMALSITVAGLIARGFKEGQLNLSSSSPRTIPVRCWLLFASLFIFSLLAPAVDRNPSRMKDEQLGDWLAACEWIRAETPADTIVWTPTNSWAFKWYAERAEYVSRKDCPQDGPGIIEWNRRMQQAFHKAFQEEERLGYAILRKGKGKLPIDPVFQNEYYRVYDLSVFTRE